MSNFNFQSFLPNISEVGISNNNGFENHFKNSNIYFNYAFKILPVNDQEKIDTIDINSLFRIKHPTDDFHNTVKISSSFKIIDSLFTLNTRQVYQLFDKHYKNCLSVLNQIEFPHPNPNLFSKLDDLDFGGFPFHFSEKVSEMIETCGRKPC